MQLVALIILTIKVSVKVVLFHSKLLEAVKFLFVVLVRSKAEVVRLTNDPNQPLRIHLAANNWVINVEPLNILSLLLCNNFLSRPTFNLATLVLGLHNLLVRHNLDDKINTPTIS